MHKHHQNSRPRRIFAARGRKSLGESGAGSRHATGSECLLPRSSIAWATKPSKNFHGSLADVRLYRGLLTEQEIEKIMSETPMGKAK